MQNPHAFSHFTVSLGFIKEVPATSCREIKASEGASAVSGNYWLDSITPGQVTLVSCDMRTGGEFLSTSPSLITFKLTKTMSFRMLSRLDVQ